MIVEHASCSVQLLSISIMLIQVVCSFYELPHHHNSSKHFLLFDELLVEDRMSFASSHKQCSRAITWLSSSSLACQYWSKCLSSSFWPLIRWVGWKGSKSLQTCWARHIRLLLPCNILGLLGDININIKLLRSVTTVNTLMKTKCIFILQ